MTSLSHMTARPARSLTAIALVIALTACGGAQDGTSSASETAEAKDNTQTASEKTNENAENGSTQSGTDTSEEVVIYGANANKVFAGGATFTPGEVTVPPGFEISVFHEGVGNRARHLAVRDNGDVFVARMNGELVALRDSDGDGKADQTETRELPITTDVEIRGDWLYFSDRVSVSRLPLGDTLLPAGDPETVISGFKRERQHAEKTFLFDESGNIYVNIGAPANACQERMRTPGSPGVQPCPLLKDYAGIWKFNGATAEQSPEDGALYVTGIRNAMAAKWHAGGILLANHGRDQLSALFPDYYTDELSAELPAEEFHLAREGDDLGWPYTYYDPFRKARMLAPEYGGDNKKTAEEGYLDPLYGFPAHWAPNDLIVIQNTNWGSNYGEGALIAFHGSWNRAPEPQAGYRVVFAPLKDGAMNGAPIDFAVGFELKESITNPGEAEHRPMGLAQAANGDIYISDSMKGTIWRVRYVGE